MQNRKTDSSIKKLNQSLLTVGSLTTELIVFMDTYDALLKELQVLKHYHVNVTHVPTPVTEVVKALIFDKIIIVGLSILEEVNKVFTKKKLPEWSAEITAFKKQISPIQKRLSQWSDLRQYRNQLLAHNLRTDTGKSIFDLGDGKHKFNVPKRNGEYVLFFELIRVYVESLFSYFEEHHSKMNFKITIIDCIQFTSVDIDMIAELRIVEKFRIDQGLSTEIEALSDIPDTVRTKADYDKLKAERNKL